jgi:hypothetical protein
MDRQSAGHGQRAQGRWEMTVKFRFAHINASATAPRPPDPKL